MAIRTTLFRLGSHKPVGLYYVACGTLGGLRYEHEVAVGNPRSHCRHTVGSQVSVATGPSSAIDLPHTPTLLAYSMGEMSSFRPGPDADAFFPRKKHNPKIPDFNQLAIYNSPDGVPGNSAGHLLSSLSGLPHIQKHISLPSVRPPSRPNPLTAPLLGGFLLIPVLSLLLRQVGLPIGLSAL